MTEDRTPTTTTRRPLVSAGTVLGMGMGGFLDGIVFHSFIASLYRPNHSCSANQCQENSRCRAIH